MTAIATPIAHTVWDMKYRLKAADGSPLDGDVRATWRRVARALAAVEPEADRASREAAFMEALEDYRFLPAGRILAGAGAQRNVTLFNCFVMGTVTHPVAKVIATKGLHARLTGDNPPLAIDVLGGDGHRTILGALWIRGVGGSFEDRKQNSPIPPLTISAEGSIVKIFSVTGVIRVDPKNIFAVPAKLTSLSSNVSPLFWGRRFDPVPDQTRCVTAATRRVSKCVAVGTRLFSVQAPASASLATPW